MFISKLCTHQTSVVVFAFFINSFRASLVLLISISSSQYGGRRSDRQGRVCLKPQRRAYIRPDDDRSGLMKSTSETARVVETRSLLELMVRYFSATSILILLVLTASLLVLPLVLPPLPPPPSILLLVPVLIMSLLMFLALFPSDVSNIVMSSV
uniref:ARGOS-like protein n=1 Tax=Nelumbo nucifera TaxID=4432 RepID=A0A822ZH69_NELNU|nr:TPA_asm: hypothetical protein HUJ06_001019 [Nelumbo nucifera]